MTSKIGIGTIRPQSPLSVSGGAAIGTNYAGNNAAPTNGLIVQDKVGIGTSSPKSPLSVSGGAAIGTSYAGSNPAPDNGLIVEGNVGIGTNNPQSSLSVSGGAAIGAGYAGSQAAPTNGLIVQGNVGIGTDDPQNPLSVSGGAAIGAGYAGSEAAPTNGLIVQGNVGIGTDEPSSPLHVSGDISLSEEINFGRNVRQKLNLWETSFGIGVQSATTYFRSGRNFAWYQGGDHNDGELNAGGGTALMVLDKDGNLGLDTASPGGKLDVRGDIKFGNTGQYFPLAGLGKFRVIAGSVYQDGSKRWGEGFTCSRHGNGFYNVYIDNLGANSCAVICSVHGFQEDREDDVITFNKYANRIAFHVYSTDERTNNVNGSFDFIVIQALS